ncbi:MAG: AtpZ/AtpI family protein [Planctomycetaceae bacterium]
MSQDPRKRPPMVVGVEWATRITTVGLEMALPAALGNYLDGRWGTGPWLVICGAALGFFIGMRHLLQFVKTDDKSRNTRDHDIKS